MNTKAQIKKLEKQQKKINAQLKNLKGNHFVQAGERWGKKLFHKVHHQVHNHSFAEWKRHYVVVKRSDYRMRQRTAGFQAGQHRDAVLRNNNLKTRLQ